jgi:hypothetical protein
VSVVCEENFIYTEEYSNSNLIQEAPIIIIIIIISGGMPDRVAVCLPYVQ